VDTAIEEVEWLWGRYEPWVKISEGGNREKRMGRGFDGF
jgi:hypothetical protein